MKSREPLKALYFWEPLQAACLVNRPKRSLVSRCIAAITTTLVDLNLSPYAFMAPNVEGGHRQERLAACRPAFPADDQAAGYLLAPGTRARGLESRQHVFDSSAPVLLRLPDPRRALRPDTPLPELLPQRFRLLALRRRKDFEALARTPPLARAALHGIKPRPLLYPLVPIGWRDAVGQGPATRLREPVEQAPGALPRARRPPPQGEKAPSTMP